MHLHLYQSLGPLLSLLAWTAIARVCNENRFRPIESPGSRSYDDIKDAQRLERRNASMLLPRDNDDVGDISDPGSTPCEPVCTYTGPIDWAKSQNKRALIDQGLTLTKRFLDIWPMTEGDKNQYMLRTCDGLKQTESIIPDSSQDSQRTRGDSTAVSAAFGDKTIRFGMSRIYGCTMMFIVSRNAVYLGHYWEGQSFDRETNPNADNEFSRQVIGMLRKKFTTVTGAVQVALKDVVNDFGTPLDLQHTFAVILTKDSSTDSKAPANKPKYPKKIASMASVAGDLMSMPTAPAILDRGAHFPPGMIHVATYVAAQKGSKALDKTAAGRMLFDYDPKGAGSRKRMEKAWRILWQNQAIMADQWE